MSAEHHYTISAGERLITVTVVPPPQGQTIVGRVGIKTAGKADWEYRTIRLDKYPIAGSMEPWRSASGEGEDDVPEGFSKSKLFHFRINSFTKPIYAGIMLRAKNPSDAPIAAKIFVDGPLRIEDDTPEAFKARNAAGIAAAQRYQAPSYGEPMELPPASHDIVLSNVDLTRGINEPSAQTDVPSTDANNDGSKKVLPKSDSKFSLMSMIAIAGAVGAATYFFAHKKDRKKNLAKLRNATASGLKRLSRGKGSWYGNNRIERAINRL